MKDPVSDTTLVAYIFSSVDVPGTSISPLNVARPAKTDIVVTDKVVGLKLAIDNVPDKSASTDQIFFTLSEVDPILCRSFAPGSISPLKVRSLIIDPYSLISVDPA